MNETAGRKHEKFKYLSGIIHLRTVRCREFPANATDPAHAPITVTELGPTNARSDARCVATLRRSGRSHAYTQEPARVAAGFDLGDYMDGNDACYRAFPDSIDLGLFD